MIAAYTGAFLAALVIALAATPVARTVAMKFGLFAIPGAGKLHINPVPYLGGLAMILAFTAAVVAGGLMGGYRGAIYVEMAVILAGGLALAGVGLLDDLRQLGVAPKIAIELAASVALYLSGTRIQLFHILPLDLLLTVAWVFGITNALNLLDNMDGLTAGISAVAASYYFVLAAFSGQFLVASLAIGLLGCALGFLWYNRPPARIFMGDMGSLFLGFMLAVIGIKLKFDNLRSVTFFVPVAVMGVAILDTSLVVFSRLRHRRPLFKGARDHISHRLISIGIPQKAALGLLYFAAVASGWAGAVIAYSRPVTGYMVIGGLVVVGAFGAYLLQRAEPTLDAAASQRKRDTEI